jgi:hypothetical protein
LTLQQIIHESSESPGKLANLFDAARTTYLDWFRLLLIRIGNRVNCDHPDFGVYPVIVDIDHHRMAVRVALSSI